MTNSRTPLQPLRHLVAAVLLLRSSGVYAADQGAAPYRERWVYCSANLQVDKSADDLIALIERAGRDGYTAMLLADYKLQILDRVIDRYFHNAERVKAQGLRITLGCLRALGKRGLP